ncbi:hypothetical protein JOD24_003060 [Kroppenstedtia sanguinis]
MANALAEKKEIDHEAADELVEMYLIQGLTLAEVIR